MKPFQIIRIFSVPRAGGTLSANILCRVISALMCAVMLAGFVLPLFVPREVYAAINDTPLRVEMFQRMDEGGPGTSPDTPSIQTGQYYVHQANVRFYVPTTDETYMLEYPIDTNKKIQVFVKTPKDIPNEYVGVRYVVLEYMWNSNTGNYEWMDTTENYRDSLTVYHYQSPLPGSGVVQTLDRYYKLDDYHTLTDIADTTSPSYPHQDAHHWVEDHDPALRPATSSSAITYNYVGPTFEVKSGQGFSFRFNGREMHMIYSIGRAPTGESVPMFEYATDGIASGNIYPFQLFRNAANPTPTLLDTQLVFTGIPIYDPESDYGEYGLKVTPYSHATDERQDPVPSSTGTGAGKIYERLVNRMEPNPPHNPAGSAEAGIEFEFEVPRVFWQTAAGTYEFSTTGPPQGLDSAYTPDDMNVTLDLRDGREGDNKVTVSISELLTSAKLGSNPEFDYISNEKYYVRYLESVTTGTKTVVRFDVANLNPSTIFNLSTFTPNVFYYKRDTNGNIITPNEVDQNRGGINMYPTEIPQWAIYTYLEYTIVPLGNDKYAVDFLPYKDYPGTYTLFGQTTNSDTGAIHDLTASPLSYQVTDGKSRITLGIMAEGTSNEIWRLKLMFQPESGRDPTTDKLAVHIYSQETNFRAKPDEAAVDIPRRFDIWDYELALTDEDDYRGTRGLLSMDLGWEVGNQSYIDRLINASPTGELKIEYDLYKGLVPDNLEIDKGHDTFAHVTIHLTPDSMISSGSAISTSKVQYEYYYLDSDGNKIPGSDGSGETELWLWDNPKDGVVQYVVGSAAKPITLKDMDARHLSLSPNGTQFKYPNIYFINVEPVMINDMPKQPPTGTSEFKSITLDDISQLGDFPPPQNIGIHTLLDQTTGQTTELISDNSATIKWIVPVDKIWEYLETFGGDLDSTKAQIHVNMYITQDEAYFRNTFSDYANDPLTMADYQTATDKRRGDSKVQDFNAHYDAPQGGWGGVFNALDTNAREALRKFGIVSIGDVVDDKTIGLIRPEEQQRPSDYYAGNPYVLEITGLDRNQKYYIYMDILVEQPDSTDKIVVRRSSPISSLFGFITKGDVEIPTGEDRYPPAPNLQVDDESVGMDRATLFWNIINPTADPLLLEETIEYEILRIQGTMMDAGDLDNRDASFKVFWDKYYLPNVEDPEDRLKGLKIGELSLSDLTYPILQFDGADFAIEADALRFSAYTPDLEQILLDDMSLMPNKMYFYYARTVKTLKDSVTGEVLGVYYSGWAYDTLTTKTVEGPINLRLESRLISYDPKTEVVISFDAHIPYVDLQEKLGIEYNLEYQVKPDGGEWGEFDYKEAENNGHGIMPVSRLIAAASPVSDNEALTHFIYKISGFQYNNGYSVRVRMVELRSGDGSLYSNVVVFKTDYDEGDYDDQKAIEDWLNHLKELLEELLKQPYWLAGNTENAIGAVYRPNYFEALLRQTVGATLELAGTEGANSATYYIPASALAVASEFNKGFVIKHGNMEIIIPPNAVDLNTNEALLVMLDRIKAETAADYYLRITVNWTEEDEFVEGDQRLTQQAEVKFELVGSVMEAGDLDGEIYSDLAISINQMATSEYYREAFKSRVKANSLDEELVLYVDSILKDAQMMVMNTVASRMNMVMAGTIELARLDKPFTLVAKDADPLAAVRAFYLAAGQWIEQDVIEYGGSWAIMVTLPGTYVFSGHVVEIPGIENEERAGVKIEIVVKYNLDDFFGEDGEFDLEAEASRFMIISSVARMAGAPNGADAVTWLKNNMNVTVSARGTSGVIQTQEALHLVTMLYAAKTNTNIETLKIRNYNTTANIEGLDDRYKQSVRAAFEVGLFNNKYVDPRQPIKVKEILDLLAKLDAKAQL
ncbi:MAG: hypothetical protein LBS62_05800 [Clostridiales bacterium]|jgi:hypothetical protein|nr:hypothetical protein [Clostridiales bacterium]